MNKRNMKIPSKQVLMNLYLYQEKTIKEISEELNMAVGKIHRLIKQYNIPTRKRTTERTKYRISKRKLGYPSPMKGKHHSLQSIEKMKIAKSNGVGKKTLSSNGYIRIYFPDHPKSDSYGYIMEHDLIMECYIGRWLTTEEVVHHKNKIKTDNRIENLELMKRDEHTRFHRLERNDDLLIK